MKDNTIDEVATHLSRIMAKKERILSKKPSERTDGENFFLRRYRLQGTEITHPSLIALSDSNTIASRVMSNVNFLMGFAPYSVASLTRYFNSYNILLDVVELNALYKSGKRLSMGLYVATLFARHFNIPLIDFMFSDLSIDGALPDGYVIPCLPDEFKKPKK